MQRDRNAWITLALTVGATARLTRLLTRDTLTRGGTDPLARVVLYNRTQRAALAAGQPIPAPTRERTARTRLWLLELLNCDWCASIWTAAPVVTTAAFAYGHARRTGHLPAWWAGPAGLLTASYVAGWLAGHDQPPDRAPHHP